MEANVTKAALVAGVALALLVGCGTQSKKQQNAEFFTSGSKEADQRASQRMAKQEQLQGSGEGAGEKGAKKSKEAKGGTSEAGGAATGKGKVEAAEKTSLYDRLGGQEGIENIVNDFTVRVLEDPRVNFERHGVTRGGISIHHGQSVAWTNSPQNVATLRKHFVQFFALATGGPPQYDGKDIKAAHEDRHISNAEFDAALGDLKSTLDKLKVPNMEQKELLAIVESTRPEIVEER
jgi:hemoglobin